jgi:hypothetical protein
VGLEKRGDDLLRSDRSLSKKVRTNLQKRKDNLEEMEVMKKMIRATED